MKNIIFKKPYPVYGAKLEVNGTNGQFTIMRQDYIDHPILNPETLSGKLLWYTTENGYDYNHPFSRAQSRANKIVNAFNKSPEQERLEMHSMELYECLWNAMHLLYLQSGKLRQRHIDAVNSAAGTNYTEQEIINMF